MNMDRRKKMESNSVEDGCSHILHTFDWFDNEWHMQIGIDDIRRLCKFFTVTLSATISYRSFVGAFSCLSSFVCWYWYVLCILIEYSSNYSSFKIDRIIPNEFLYYNVYFKCYGEENFTKICEINLRNERKKICEVVFHSWWISDFYFSVICI